MSVLGIIIIILVIFTFIMVGLEFLRSRYVLNVTHSVVSMDSLPKNFDGTKMVVIGDLHQMRFGDYNELLAKKIKIEEPDYIFFVGDMGDSRKYNVDAFYDLLETLGRDIPFIMVPGNHDLRLGGGKVHKNFLREVSNAGAVLLDNACAEMKAGDDKLYIYGFCQPLQPQKDVDINHWRLSSVSDGYLSSTLGKCPDDAPVILLAHDPTYFSSYSNWGANLVLSGHIHGGMVRLPFVGGIFSPSRKLFPKYTSGLYEKGDSKLFVTRGLGSSIMTRFGNPPEISVVTLACPASAAAYEAKNKKAKVELPAESFSDWFKAEFASFKSLMQERANQVSDFFSEMFGKKKSRFSKEADRRKKKNTYTVDKASKRMPKEEKHIEEDKPYIYTKNKKKKK